MNKLKKFIDDACEAFTDDSRRIVLQYIWIYIILMLISVFMSVVNFFTGKLALMAATLTFAALNLFNILLSKTGSRRIKLASYLFISEIIALFTFFIISGMPEGFSAIWICLLPSSGLLLFKRKRGTVVCAVMFVIMIFLFQLPAGRALLHYKYTDSFMLRFPMLYIAFYGISLFLETVRALTYEKLLSTQKQYEYLYLHDSLTDVYNRYGFNEKLTALLDEPSRRTVTLMLLDIDYFKGINDRYGHTTGDTILKEVAALLVRLIGS